MATVELPELTFVPLLLYSELRVVKTGGPAARRAVPDVVALGVPQAVRLDAGSVPDDPDLARFLRARADRSFALVTLGATFHPNDHTVTRATVEVSLAADPAGDPPVVAWSLAPRRVTEPVTVTRKITVSADAKIVHIGMELSQERAVQDVFLEAFNELRSDPSWEFTATPTSPIRGSHRLTMVTSASTGSLVTGTVTVSAVLEHRRFGLFSTRSEDGDSVSFAID